MRRDKLVVELLLILLLFFGLYAFSGEISAFFQDLEDTTDIKPIKSSFWFLALVFELFGHWLFLIISYLVVAGIVYLIERRKG